MSLGAMRAVAARGPIDVVVLDAATEWAAEAARGAAEAARAVALVILVEPGAALPSWATEGHMLRTDADVEGLFRQLEAAPKRS